MTRRSLAVAPVLCATLLAACGSDSPDRAAVVSAMTVTAVPARYGQLADDADALAAEIPDWCETGDDAPVRERSATVRNQWLGLAPFWFGPAMDRRSRFIIDPSIWVDDIDDLLVSDDPLDATGLRERFGADQRGLQALDVLLDADDRTDRHCDYAVAITELVADEARLLADDWLAFGPEQGAGEEAANDSLEQVVNETLFAIDAMIRQPDPGDPAKLSGVRWAIVGDGTDAATGLSALLDDEVVDQLRAEFEASESLDAEALGELDRTIATNIVSALGLSVQFSDADGDG